MQPEKLEQITNWAAKGLTHAEIAESMGISRETLYQWINKFPDISYAIKKGRSLSVQAIENKFFQTAFGEVFEEIEVIEETEVLDHKGNVKKLKSSKKTKRKLPPNVTAQIFYLKNHAGYSDKPKGFEDIEDSDAFFKDIGI